MTRTIPILSMLVAMTAACGSDSNDGSAGGEATVAIRLALTASTPPGGSTPGAIVLEDEAGSAFTIEGAEAYVRHIRLDLPDGESCADLTFEFAAPVSCDGSKIEIGGPFLVDLIAGTSQPSLADLQIPPGTYKRVDVRFEDAEPGEGLVKGDDTLADHSMHATGSFDREGTDTSFELLLKFNEDARFEAPSGITLGASGGSDALLMLDVSRWFEALPVTECIDDGDLTIEDGTLRIDDERSECSDIENTLKDAIKNSGQLEGA